MGKIEIGGVTYNIQQFFVGKQSVEEAIREKVFADFPQLLPLTNVLQIQYNKSGDSVGWRNNGI